MATVSGPAKPAEALAKNEAVYLVFGFAGMPQKPSLATPTCCPASSAVISKRRLVESAGVAGGEVSSVIVALALSGATSDQCGMPEVSAGALRRRRPPPGPSLNERFWISSAYKPPS